MPTARIALALAALAGTACTPRREPRSRPLAEQEIAAGQFVLRARRLAATVMVPDRPASVYAGQRFESGGVVMQVTLDGEHAFLGREPRGERLGGIGLIEEIGISAAVGYEAAKPGEPFLKLGVGLLRRGDDPKYRFFPPHPEVDRFPWDVTVAGSTAAFVQVGRPFGGTAYRYEKRIVLDPAEPVLRIEHALTNTGEKPIVSDQYCHNFFAFGAAPPGPDYMVATEFPLQPELPPKLPMLVEERSLTFREVVQGAAYCRFKAQPPGEESHRFVVRHKASGLSVTVEGDFPIAIFACYADTVALSPEAYCALHVKPGETFRWTRTYTFAAR